MQFLRTIRRHRNILFFFGVCNVNTPAPFIVMEYVARGALNAILQDERIPLSRARKLSFALDAATGIRILHELQPPRIHRDIKSGNLLVAEVCVCVCVCVCIHRDIKSSNLLVAEVRVEVAGR